MTHPSSHTSSPSSHSATAGLDAHTNNSYHDSTPLFYSHNNNSSTTSSSSHSLNLPAPLARTNQPQGPQGQSDSNTAVQPPGATTFQGPVSDAWAEHGHFPLSLDSVSRRTVSARGGSTILLIGENFRAGVQVVIACSSLGESRILEPKVVTPRVLKSTEMEFIVPNLLDWASSSTANSTNSSSTTLTPKALQLSVTLTCEGGEKVSSDPIIAFDMVAVEDSETELLHTIIGLHRQLIHASLTAELNVDTERTARQRTLALLNLDKPPTVTRTEHLALGVIYMLCDGRDVISDEGMDIVRTVTQDGHDMLHLAVVLGLKTLVRELARHLLGTFQSCAITSESEVFTRDPNGFTALDLATILGHEEIEKVLAATLQAAQDHKRTILGRAARPLPSIPPPQSSPSGSRGSSPPKPSRSSTLNGSPVPSATASSTLASETGDRPLPPTPMTSPYKDSPPETQGNPSFFPTMAGIDATLAHSPSLTEPIVSTATSVTSASSDHHPPHRVNTAQAIIEDDGNHPGQYHGGVPLTTAEHSSVYYPAHNDPHVVAQQYPTYHLQHHPHQNNQHQHAQWPQHHHQQPHPYSQPQSHHYPPHHQQQYQKQQHHEEPLHTFVQNAPTLPNMPHLQAHGHHLMSRPELPTPPRANSVPVPGPRPYNPESSYPQQHQLPPVIENHSPTLLSTSPAAAGSYRPLPTAPLKAPSSLPPPKHKVTRVNRPKNFVVSTSVSETNPTSMPVPELPLQHQQQQHRPMVIPPLLPDPYPIAHAGHHQHSLPVPLPIPMMQHSMPQKQDLYGAPRQDDQIKVPIA
ncbi:hypothetical protein K457DRAFT_135097 [Linnemannia elongata AG-77]|uniref:Uncharacterized protein n=1 Tax=Linnemannia elongata AG-77 TaxID=1314771 RepID=A0A197K7Z0_9FUNG|nr:hypothetical protein K457DRAFT_135097 [Linnemannia elongata AG-77]